MHGGDGGRGAAAPSCGGDPRRSEGQAGEETRRVPRHRGEARGQAPLEERADPRVRQGDFDEGAHRDVARPSRQGAGPRERLHAAAQRDPPQPRGAGPRRQARLRAREPDARMPLPAREDAVGRRAGRGEEAEGERGPHQGLPLRRARGRQAQRPRRVQPRDQRVREVLGVLLGGRRRRDDRADRRVREGTLQEGDQDQHPARPDREAAQDEVPERV